MNLDKDISNDNEDFALSSHTPQSTKKSKQLYNLAIGSIEKTKEKTKIKKHIDIEDIELYNIYETNDGIDALNTTLEQLAFTSPSNKSIKPKKLKKLLDKLKGKKSDKKSRFMAPVLEAIIGKEQKESPAKNRKTPNININNNVETNSKATYSSIFPMIDYVQLRILLTKSSFYKASITIPLCGLFCAFLIEMLLPYHCYNVVILLVLLASSGFQFFPVKTARPQLLISFVTVVSIAVDIISIVSNEFNATIPGYYIALIIVVICTKLFTLQHFLKTGKGTRKAREILIKKLRIFVFSYKRPYSMREIRLRIIALGWIELTAIAIYALLLMFSITSFQYSLMFASASATVALPVALIIKSVLSAVLFLTIFLDTDIILALSKFGCLGFSTRFVKDYIEKKKKELGGPPRVYDFNLRRFQFWTFIKIADVILGIILWIALAQASRSNFSSLQTDFKAFLGLNVGILIVTDIWVPLLVSVIYLMLKKKNADDDSDSDASIGYDASPVIKRTPKGKGKGNVEATEVDDVDEDDDDEDDEDDDDDEDIEGEEKEDYDGNEEYEEEYYDNEEYENEQVDGDIENDIVEDESSPLHQKAQKATSQFHSVRDNIRRGSSKNAFGSADADSYSSPNTRNEKTNISYPQESVHVRIQPIDNDLYAIFGDSKQRVYLGNINSIITKAPSRRGHGKGLVIDHSSSIDSHAYDTLYSALSGAFSSEFNCKIILKHDFTFDKFTQNLIKNGFVIVTSNHTEGLFECQLFASGYIDHDNILFLANIRIILSDNNTSSSSSSSVMQCTAKSTRNHHHHYFIANFALGDLLTLTD